MSRIGAPFTEKKIETKIAAANAGCRNKMNVRQRKISHLRVQLSSTLRQQENRNLKKIIRCYYNVLYIRESYNTVLYDSLLYMRIKRLTFGHPLYSSSTCQDRKIKTSNTLNIIIIRCVYNNMIVHPSSLTRSGSCITLYYMIVAKSFVIIICSAY